MSVKYIFCISTGRCGTDYLCGLFKQLDKCNAFHEQKPLLNNEQMRAYLNGDKEALRKQLPLKLTKIFKEPSKLFVDTSHLFIKGFGWELPNHIAQTEIGVIILKRPKEEVVKSTQRVQSGPFSYKGRKWIIVPYRNALVQPPINRFWYNLYRYVLKFFWFFKGELHSEIKTYPKFFEKKSEALLNWYYDETYALSEKFKKDFPQITYINVTLKELNTIEGFTRIIDGFNLGKICDLEKIKPIIGKAKNLKREFNKKK